MNMDMIKIDNIDDNKLDITFPVLVSQLSGHIMQCIIDSLWRRQQNVNRASETQESMLVDLGAVSI